MARAPVPPLDQGIFLVHLSRARKHLAEERFDLARQELELAELARPNDEDVLNLLSVIEFKRGYYHEAAQAARALLEKNPSSAVLHCNLGLILFKAGVLGEAEQELRKAIDVKPDHPRSHLYLGLLYRMRGKLGLAVEHLKFAGANRVVTEIEESLRRTAREGPLPRSAVPEEPTPIRPGATERRPAQVDTAPTATESPAAADLPPFQVPDDLLSETLSGPVRASAEPPPATPVPVAPPPAPVTEAQTPIAAGPTASGAAEPPEKIRVTSTVVSSPVEAMPSFSRETAPDPRGATRDTDGRPLFHVRPDGGLEIASRGVVFVRKGSVVWYSGKIRFSAEPAFRGTRLEKILRADGRGYLFVNDPGRSAFRRDLSNQSLYLEGSRLLALDHGLSFRLEPIHDFRMNRRVDILKIQGRGSVILSVGGPLLAHEVSSEFPLNVSSRDLVAWTGDLVPSVLEDRFLEEVMMPDVGSAPKIRFEGTGTVLTEPPRPRRRASDLARPSEADRR
ncbi:MAG TPA: tetratricopeptide repeat protein [Thermoanaerobaculia bacterium]